MKAVLLLSALAVAAADAAPLPVESFFRPAEFAQPALSPDGSHLAALVHTGDARHLVVLDVDTGNAASLTNRMEYEVGSYYWIDNKLLRFYVINDRDRDNDRFARLGDYVIRRDGSKYWKTRAARTILSRLPHDPKNVLASAWDRRRGYPEVWLAPVRKGNWKRVQGNPFNVTQWFVDGHDRVRAGWDDVQGTDQGKLLYRADEQSEWLHVLDIDDNDQGFSGFDPDGRHIYINSSVGTDRFVIYRYDPVARERKEMVAADPEFSVQTIRYSPGKKTPMYAHYPADRPRHVYLSDDWESIMRGIDQALPDTHNDVVDASDDERRLLIRAYSDRVPGNYYLYDLDARNLRYLFSERAWIDADAMARMTPVRYEARDGLTIHGYLTLPPDRQHDEAVPLVLYVHGGPYGVRDIWGFDPEIQFLASRGYAVLNVNFRGSGGYGRRFEQLGYHQFGLTMQDDLTDAVLWAIDQGYADPDRVCIMGASYGGYATMMGLVKTPDLYACGVNFVGVTDLFEIHKNDTRHIPLPGRHQAGKRWFHKRIGNPAEDRERFIATSPVRHVDRIEAPVFLAHGYYDGRVDVHDHFYKLIRQLKKHDKDFETLLEKNEGHGLFFHENRIEYWTAVAGFLSEHLD